MPSDNTDRPDNNSLPVAMLPAVPLDSSAGRSPSAISTATQDGSAAFSMSAGAVIDATALHLAAAAGSLEWAIYQFHPTGEALSSVFAHLGYDSGAGTWIGLADYSSLAWKFSGPYPVSGEASLSSLSGGNYLSGGGNVYLLVAAFDATSTTVNSIDFSTGSAATVFGISGTVSVSGGGALAGVTLTLTPGGQTAASSASGAYSFGGIATGSYTLTPSLAGYSFSPGSLNVTLGPDATAADFTGTLIPQTFSISGKVSDASAAAIAGVTLTLTPGNIRASSSAQGTYSFPGLAAGSYTVTPSKTGFTFAPVNKSVSLGPDASGVNFSGTPEQQAVTYINDVKPIFDSLCIACHGSSLAFKSVKLHTYTDASANASKSLAAVLDDSMPQGGRRLTAAEKAAIQDWISGGKLQ